MNSGSEFQEWDLHESGPHDAPHTVLLLPGGMCTAAFYEDLMAEPRLVEAELRLVAATLPGFGNTPPAKTLTMEHYAELTGELAARLGCDLVVGHSFGANVALEMAAGGHWSGPLVLLSPTFSHQDEVRALDLADRLAHVPGLGKVTWAALLKLMPYAMKDNLPEHRRDELIAELKKNDAEFCRRLMHNCFTYFDRHGSLVGRLCESGARSWVVRGDKDEVGLTDEEVQGLRSCPGVTMIEVPDATHMVITDQPGWVAEVVLEALAGPGTG